jgi:hypothetical protein
MQMQTGGIMKVGDKVRLMKSESHSKVGIIKSVLPVAMPQHLITDGLVKTNQKKYFGCIAEDGTLFFGWQDELEPFE